MTLTLRPLSIRLRVAYMAIAYREAMDTPVETFEAGSSLDRHFSETKHPYVSLWGAIGRFYRCQGFDKLCDAEILDRFNAALTVGFKTSNGRQVTASMVQKAVKHFEKCGWFRYEHQHAGRLRIAKRVSLFGLAFVGIPIVSDL